MKKKIFLVINYLVTVGMLYWMVQNFDFKKVIEAFGSVDYRFLLTAVLVSLVFRLGLYPALWQSVLRFGGLPVKYGDLFLVNAVSLPLKYVLPFKITEVVRAAGLKIFTRLNFPVALSSAIFLRVTITIATVGLFISGMAVTGNLRWFWWVVMVLIALLVLLLYLDWMPRNFLGLNEMFGELVYCFEKISELRKGGLIIYSMIVQFGEILSSYLIFCSLGVNISFLETVYYVSLVMLVSMVPVAVQGIGLREAAMVVGLSAFVPAAQGLSAGLMLTMIHHLLPAIVGGIIWLTTFGTRVFAGSVARDVV